MWRFELAKGAHYLDSILNQYRRKKRRRNYIEADTDYDGFANSIDEESIGFPLEWENIECSGSNSPHPTPFSPTVNSSTVNLHGCNDEPSESRLDQIAQALGTLTYGEMLELAESMWKVNSQGSAITESDLPSVLYRWSTSRIEN
jgi:hypothetical protein